MPWPPSSAESNDGMPLSSLSSLRSLRMSLSRSLFLITSAWAVASSSCTYSFFFSRLRRAATRLRSWRRLARLVGAPDDADVLSSELRGPADDLPARDCEARPLPPVPAWCPWLAPVDPAPVPVPVPVYST